MPPAQVTVDRLLFRALLFVVALAISGVGVWGAIVWNTGIELGRADQDILHKLIMMEGRIAALEQAQAHNMLHREDPWHGKAGERIVESVERLKDLERRVERLEGPTYPY